MAGETVESDYRRYRPGQNYVAFQMRFLCSLKICEPGNSLEQVSHHRGTMLTGLFFAVDPQMLAQHGAIQ